MRDYDDARRIASIGGGEELEEATRSYVKPAVGFTLPSAGLSPAPSEKKTRNVEDNLSLSGSVPCVIQSGVCGAKNPDSFFRLVRTAAAASDTSPVILRERRPGGGGA